MLDTSEFISPRAGIESRAIFVLKQRIVQLARVFGHPPQVLHFKTGLEFL